MNAEPILSVLGVSKSYGGLRALHDVTFEVGEGRILGIIGPNGAGKTTLFGAISGGLTAASGAVRFAGTDVTHWSDHRRARAGLVRTFQLMRPFAAMSVLDNVAVAAQGTVRRRGQARAAADAVIERVGLARYRDQRSGALPTAALKRLELARALALRPRVLLLDEVLAGLLPAEREPVLDLIANLRDEGVTIVFVEHVMAAVMRLSDEVLVLDRGRVLAVGPPAAVTRDARVVEAYLGTATAAERPDADARPRRPHDVQSEPPC
ncbi:ABC transporter ATP-binding protein [Actinoallomurus acanthiterrae]